MKLKITLAGFFLIIQFTFTSYGQSVPRAQESKKTGLIDFPAYEPPVHKEIDTLYYPYYDDVQMLRITHRYAWFDHPTFVKTDVYDYIQQVPVYLFRNRKGEIVKRFNTLGREISTEHLHHADDPHQDQWKHVRLRNSAYMGDAKNLGLWGIYPMYIKNENDELRVGLFDSLGNTYMKPVYESIEYKDSIFIVQRNGKFGLLDYNQKVLLDINYDEITYERNYHAYILTKRDGKCGIYFKNGKNFVPEEYSSITESDYLRPGYAMTKNGKWYFADPYRKKILSYGFPTSSVMHKGDHFLMNLGKEWQLVDSTGKILCRSKNQIEEMLSPNRFISYRWSGGTFRQLIDSSGTLVKETEYSSLIKLNENVLIAWIMDYSLRPGDNAKYKVYLLDLDGNQICDDEFDGLEKIDNHYLKAYKNGKTYFINERGKIIIDEKIDGAGKLFEHVFMYAKDGKYFLFDPQNPTNKSEAYDQISYKSEGTLGVKKGEKYGFLDSNRNVLTGFIYDHIQPFHFGVAQVKINENWFLIDKLGNVLSDDYSMTQDLGGGFTMINKKNKFGVINNKGRIIVQPEYDKCVTISKKKDEVFGFILRKDKKDGMIDTKGNIIHPFDFEVLYDINGNNSSYEFVREGYYAGGWIHKRTTREFYHFNYDSTKNKLEVKENPNMGFEIVIGAKRGVRNWEKKMVIPQKYDNIEAMKFNTFKVYDKEKGCGLMDTNGKVIIPLKYVYLRDHYDDYIMVGRSYQSDWGLFKYDGIMIADTLYGGFERSHMGMIPFYSSFNHRYDKEKGWLNDTKKVGLMDQNGQIIVKPEYDEYRIPDQFKDEFLFISSHETILVDSKGKVIERKVLSGEKNSIPEEPEKGFIDRIFRKKKPKYK